MELPEKIAGMKEQVDIQGRDFRELSKKVDSIYPKLNEVQGNFDTILTSVEKFEEVIAKFGKDYQETVGKLEQFKKVLDQRLNDVNTETDEKLGRFVAQFSDISKRISGSDARDMKDIDSIKIALVDFKRQLAEIGETLTEAVEVSKKFATNEQLHKHYAELKMDLASSEGRYDKKLEEISGGISEIKSEMENFPKIKDLEDADVVLLRRIKELESRTSRDLDAVVAEFKEFGKLFAKKEDVRSMINEEKEGLLEASQRLTDISGDMNNRISNFEQNQGVFNQRVKDELAERFGMMEQLRSEMNVIKEQVIVTQNAIVELNAFLREQFSK